jgi:hypothetical protein
MDKPNLFRPATTTPAPADSLVEARELASRNLDGWL